MTRSLENERYLKKRNGWYYYYRRVPTALRPFYENDLIRISLDTRSSEVARVRRDELADADDDYWGQLKLSISLEKAGERIDTGHARQRYEIAKARALSAGFKFKPMKQLVDPSQVEEIVRRMLALENTAASDGTLNPVVIDAVLGGVDEPKVTVSEVMEIYKSKIAKPDLIKKSPAQLKLWHATKDRSLRYFVDEMGDLVITEITREQAQEYFEFWNQQVTPEDTNVKPKSPKAQKRRLGILVI